MAEEDNDDKVLEKFSSYERGTRDKLENTLFLIIPTFLGAIFGLLQIKDFKVLVESSTALTFCMFLIIFSCAASLITLILYKRYCIMYYRKQQIRLLKTSDIDRHKKEFKLSDMITAIYELAFINAIIISVAGLSLLLGMSFYLIGYLIVTAIILILVLYYKINILWQINYNTSKVDSIITPQESESLEKSAVSESDPKKQKDKK
jgi:hypothetical protein